MLTEENQEQPKDIKKLVTAFQFVFKHENDREPDESEVAEFLHSREAKDTKALQQEEEEKEPAVLKTQVIESRGGEPLFYLSGGRCFDTEKGEWLPNVPAVIAELPSRPATKDDLSQMVIHGLVPPEEFELLKSRGLVGHTVGRLYDKLNPKTELAKSVESDETNLEIPENGIDEETPLEEFPIDWEEDNGEFLDEMIPQGPNPVEELFRLASIFKFDKRVEAAIREIVQDEISKVMYSQLDDPTEEPLEQSMQADAAANLTSNSGVVPGNASPV